MNYSVKLLLEHSVEKVTYAISRHERNENAPLSRQVLLQIKKELEEMIRVMDPKIYKPSYPRFILDWPDEKGLIEELIDVAYQYNNLKRI